MTTPDPTRSKAIEVMARGIENCRIATRKQNDAMLAKRGLWADHNFQPSDTSYAAAALTAYESHLQAEGMAVVPVEPTARMIIAGASAKPIANRMNTLTAAVVWFAMLSASPYGKASMQEASAEAQSAVANTPSMKAGKEESK